MKENKYDNEEFFEQYSRFPRSVEGLSAADDAGFGQKAIV